MSFRISIPIYATPKWISAPSKKKNTHKKNYDTTAQQKKKTNHIRSEVESQQRNKNAFVPRVTKQTKNEKKKQRETQTHRQTQSSVRNEIWIRSAARNIALRLLARAMRTWSLSNCCLRSKAPVQKFHSDFVCIRLRSVGWTNVRNHAKYYHISEVIRIRPIWRCCASPHLPRMRHIMN